MKTGIDSAEYSTIFAALKLIECLYQNGVIQRHIFRNILEEYSDRIDISRFGQ